MTPLTAYAENGMAILISVAGNIKVKVSDN